MGGVVLITLKVFLIVVALLGLVFHLLVLRSPQSGRKVEEKLRSEFGTKKRFVHWLEIERMELHKRLMGSKVYNILAVIFLLVLLALLFQI